MVSPFSPPVLYLTDDDDDNEPEPNMPYISSYSSVVNDNLPGKKRRLPNTNVRTNPSAVNWSKRQRNDHYPQQQQQQQQPPIYNSIHHTPERMVFNSDVYDFPDPKSHSFHAFDWTSEPRIPPRTYSNPIQTTSRMAIVPAPTVMNVVKHHLDQSDTVPINPLSHSNGRYVQHSAKKPANISIPGTPPSPSLLPLPLPTPTSSLVRPQAQRIHSEKNVRIPYPRSTPLPPPPPPPPLPSVPVHHSIKPVFSPPSSSTTCRSSSNATISNSILVPEIRRQPLNGTGVLSAFYDSKCYRCNICKFITITSSKLLQHLFTHIFFCHQCSFYSYSQHNLYQHMFEKHHSIPHTDNIDPKSLELLYITRCLDGTFALCMDSSSPAPAPAPVPPPPLPPAPATTSKANEKPTTAAEKITKPKTPKRKPRTKKVQDNDIIVLAEERDPNPQPSSSSEIIKRPVAKEKPSSTYVLMKHRRCYSFRYPPCLHPLTLEYNICREHTIRHMCHTQGAFNRRKLKPKPNERRLSDDAAMCLKTVVNRVVEIEDDRSITDIVCQLPNSILDLIFPTDDLHIITNLLKLNNKFDKFIEQNDQNQLESSIRTSNQHVFILSSIGAHKNDQSILSSVHSSITSSDSMFTNTKLNELPVSYDNTHRFLKGNRKVRRPSINSTEKTPPTNDTSPRPIKPKNSESLVANLPKPPRYTNFLPTSSIIDKNNNPVTSSKARLSPTPSVIVID